MINLPVDWLAQYKAPIGEIFSDLAPIIFLLLGVFLGIYIIERIVDLIKN